MDYSYGNDGTQHQVPQDGRMGQLPLPPGAHRRPDGRVILPDGSTQGMHPGMGHGLMAPHPNTQLPPFHLGGDTGGSGSFDPSHLMSGENAANTGNYPGGPNYHPHGGPNTRFPTNPGSSSGWPPPNEGIGPGSPLFNYHGGDGGGQISLGGQPPMVHNDLLTRGPGVGAPGSTPPWQAQPMGGSGQPFPGGLPAQTPGAPTGVTGTTGYGTAGQPYPGIGGGSGQTPPWMQPPPSSGGMSGSSSGGYGGPPLPTAPGSPYGPPGAPSPSSGSMGPSPYGSMGAGGSGGSMTGLSPGVPGGPPLPTAPGSPYTAGAGVVGGNQSGSMNPGVMNPGGAGGAGSPFPHGSTGGSSPGMSYGNSAGAPTQNVQGLGVKAHDLGVMNNYGQVQNGKIWMNAGGGGQGAWTNYNPNDQIQKGIADQFSRYGSSWYSGNNGAYGHMDDMKPQWQALHPGQTGTQQDYSDLYMGVHPGEQQAAHDAFSAQSAAFNPASSSYDPNSQKQLTSLNLLAHQ